MIHSGFFVSGRFTLSFVQFYLLHLQKVQKYIAMVDVLQVPGPEACTSTTEFLKQFFIVDFASVSFFEAVCNCKLRQSGGFSCAPQGVIFNPMLRMTG